MSLRAVRTRSIALCLIALGASACELTSDGSTGDPPSEPNGSVLGDGARIRDVVKPATWLEVGNMNSDGCKVPNDHTVDVTGQVIVAVDRYDETGDGTLGNIYVEDLYEDDQTPKPYSGITVFGPAFTPPDLRVFEGDVVDTFGNLSEFLGPSSGRFGDCKTLPEIGGTMTFRFDHGPVEPLTVVSLNGGSERWQPILGYEQARQYIGMLIRIEGVRITGTPKADSKGRYTAQIDMGGGISAEDGIKLDNELFDLENEGPPLQGAQFQAVSGVLTYFYGFKLAPRSADDFEM